jgi:protein involved in polysaccharide export with SLBB domain
MDRSFKARLERRFGEQLTGPVRQRHDETEIRIGPGDVVPVITALHDEPSSPSSSWRIWPVSTRAR